MSEQLEALVLAAGSGSRFGGPKLLAPWRGGVLLDAALAAALAAPARTVTVVTGAYADAIEAVARAAVPEARLRLVHAPKHAEGLSASLKAGVAALPGDAAGVFVFLGDMPKVPHGIAAELAALLVSPIQAAAPVRDGQRGHPVLLSAELFPALAALRGDQGAGPILKVLGRGLALLETDDPGVLRDIDRPSDLAGS